MSWPFDVVVYSKSGCTQCDIAKRILKSREIPFKEIVLDNPERRQAFYEVCGPGVRQMPQIFFGDQRVGGVAGLQQALKDMDRQ